MELGRQADRLRGPAARTTSFGRGKIEDFTWKGMLDFATCTECGRCQSQCPAWNTGKPLSPKLVIMDLRDHLMAKAPYLIGGKDMPEEGAVSSTGGADQAGGHGHHVPESGFGRVPGLRPGAGGPAAGRHRWSRAGSSTPTCCGRAPRAGRASSSARWTSSTSTTSSTCAATRC